jgi:hypothetical protein
MLNPGCRNALNEAAGAPEPTAKGRALGPQPKKSLTVAGGCL